jgi:hypothetical protein
MRLKYPRIFELLSMLSLVSIVVLISPPCSFQGYILAASPNASRCLLTGRANLIFEIKCDNWWVILGWRLAIVNLRGLFRTVHSAIVLMRYWCVTTYDAVFIQCNMIVESEQNVMLYSVKSIACITAWYNLISSTAVYNSRHNYVDIYVLIFLEQPL